MTSFVKEYVSTPSSRPSNHSNLASHPSSASSSRIGSRRWRQFNPAIDAVTATVPPSGICGRSASVRRSGASTLTRNTVSGGSVSATPALLNSRVDRALDLCDGGVDRGGVGEVGAEERRVRARRLLHVEHRHVGRAELGEDVEQRGTDAGRRAGHHDPLAAEVQIRHQCSVRVTRVSPRSG